MFTCKHIISRRVCIVVLCLIGVVWVPVLKDLEGGELFMYINAVQSYFSPPIGAVYLLAVLWKRSNEKVSFIHFSSMVHFYTPCTVWKGFVFGAFLLRIFPHSDGIRRDMEYLSVFSPNAEKYGPEKLRIRTLFTQCWKYQKTKSFLTFPRAIEMEHWAILGIYRP